MVPFRRWTRAGRALFLILAGCEVDGSVALTPPTLVEVPVPVPAFDGWDDAPGSGAVFVVQRLDVAGKDQGFDVDRTCEYGDCVDNELWILGDLDRPSIAARYLRGSRLLLIEIAGLDPGYQGDDDEVTVKAYDSIDADDPFFPANNFEVPPGLTTCCEFLAMPGAIDPSTGQARSRFRARIEGERLTTLEPAPILLSLPTGLPPDPVLTLERAQISLRLPLGLDQLGEGLIGGAVPVPALAGIDSSACLTLNPHCPQQTGDVSLLDVVRLVSPTPDIDLDGDGLQANSANDGYSLALTIHALPAILVGVSR